MKQLARFCLVLFTATVFSLLITACNPEKSNKNKYEPAPVTKIGAILPLTGALSEMGTMEKNAMQLAEKQMNNDSSNKFKLIIEDNKGTQKDAAAAANKLINIEGVDVLITSTTGASLTIQPIAEQNKVNHIAFCMDPTIAAQSKYTTRYYIGINQEAMPIIEYFNNLDSAANIGILHAEVAAFDKVIDSVYYPDIKSHSIVYRERYKIGETDFRNKILKLKNSNVSHLIILGYGFQYPFIFKELEAGGHLDKITILGGWGFLYTDVDQSLLQNILVSGPEYVFRRDKIASRFYNDFEQVYGIPPNFDAAFAYNVIEAMANIPHEAFESPIKAIIQNKENVNSVVGRYRISKEGNMMVPTSLGIIQGNEIKLY